MKLASKLLLPLTTLLLSNVALATELQCQVSAKYNDGFNSPCEGSDYNWKKPTTQVDVRLVNLSGTVSQVIWNGTEVCQGTSCINRTFSMPTGVKYFSAQVLYTNGTWETLNVTALWDNLALGGL